MKSAGRARQVALRIFCALLLVFSGLAHRPTAMAAAPALATLELPDGTTPDLCIGNFGAQKDPGAKVGFGCDACRLAGATILPVPTAIAHASPASGAVFTLPQSQTGSHQFLYRQGAPPRAPPAMLA